MNQYTPEYLQSHDIDWFYVVNGIPIHFASAGGIIPNSVNNREKLRFIQRKVNNLHNILEAKDIQINPNLEDQFHDKEALNEYLYSFMSMAKKGFVSYDRKNIEDVNSVLYTFVCGPRIYLKDNSVLEILKSVPHIDAGNIDVLNTIQIIDIVKDLEGGL